MTKLKCSENFKRRLLQFDQGEGQHCKVGRAEGFNEQFPPFYFNYMTQKFQKIHFFLLSSSLPRTLSSLSLRSSCSSGVLHEPIFRSVTATPAVVDHRRPPSTVAENWVSSKKNLALTFYLFRSDCYFIFLFAGTFSFFTVSGYVRSMQDQKIS